MKIETWPIKNVKPYPANPRVNDGAVDAVAKSIEAFGFRQPIVVDKDGVVIAGHTRLKAAEKLGMIVVPVHVASDMSPDKVRGYRLADNRTAELSEWNFDLLVTEIKALEELGLDTSLLGWDAAELAELFAQETVGLVDEDEVPAPPDEPVTQAGDLIILGNHRLLCGDSGNAADLATLLDGAVIDMANLDPPYGVKVESRSNNSIASGQSSYQGSTSRPVKGTTKQMRAKDRPLANDFLPDDEFDAKLRSWFKALAHALKPGGVYYAWGGYSNCGAYPPALKANGLYFAQAIIWDKEHPVMSRKDFLGAHEWCFYGWKEGAGHHFYGPKNVPDLWHVKKVTPQAMVHLTEKPVELARRAIEYSSKPGERVLDLFGGSGSTLIAAEQTGRKAYLMELDRAYCDVIVSRWESFTGKKAERQRAVAVA